MAQTLCVIPPAEDCARLAAIVGDRNRPHKHIQRARIILLSAERLTVAAVPYGIGRARHSNEGGRMSQLTLETADRIIDAALAARRQANAKPICVVVLDGSGHMVALKREDGASMFRPDVALGKAWGCVAMGDGGRALAKKARENPAFFAGLAATSNGRLLPQPGGVLVRASSGAVLGAVGISGDTGPNDEAFAVAGIEAAGFVADTGE